VQRLSQEDDVVLLPLVAIDETILRSEVGQFVEQHAAFILRQALDLLQWYGD
jgi:hypothetical protein